MAEPGTTYLDHAATTPMLPEAVAAMTEALTRTGNASSLHSAGRRSRRLVEESRERIAAAVGARPSEVVLTTGGTGLSPRDVTPEATRAVLEREAPGIAERLRITSLGTFPRAALSRGTAGVRARTLVVNLPGSPGGVRDALAALDAIVDHACDVVRGGGERDHAVQNAEAAQ